ncbi:MAG: dicarboxylate/amino acid:cation symporter, partial [Candidatus Moraniibacteriota bacterium]
MTDPLKLIHPKNLKHLNIHIYSLVKNRLWIKIIIGLILGSTTGFVFGPDLNIIGRESASVLGEWLALPGQLFLALIQMIVIPLVFASVIRGLASGESLDQLKKMGGRVVVYFLFTSVIAVVLGVVTVSLIKPGNYVDTSSLDKSPKEVSVDKDKLASDEIQMSELPSAIVSIIPKNPLGEMVNTEMLQIVIFSIVVGVALISLNPKQSQPLLNLLGSIQSVSMKVVGWAMRIAPLAVFGLIAQLTIQTGLDTLTGIGAYVATVLLALFGMLCFYLILAMLVGKWKPWSYLAKIKDVQLLAFSTDSSVATMPLSIKTAQEKLKVRSSISQFIIPVGATINMDATALFQGVATVFIAQVYSLELGMG